MDPPPTLADGPEVLPPGKDFSTTHPDKPELSPPGDFTLQTLPEHNLTKIQDVLTITSFVCLTLAIAIWVGVCFKNRTRSAYRYIMLLFVFVTCLASLFLEELRLFDVEICFSDQTAEQIILFSLTGYSILCMARAVSQRVRAWQVSLCILTVLLIALLLSGLEWALGLLDVGVHDMDAKVMQMVLVEVPRFICLSVGLIITSILLYWLCAWDNSRYSGHREYKVIRHGSVCLLLVLAVCTGVEIHRWLRKYHHGMDITLNLQTYNIGKVTQTLAICLFLCFVDRETLDLCPCFRLEESKAEEKALLADGSPDPPTTKVQSLEKESSAHPPKEPPKPAYGTVPSGP